MFRFAFLMASAIVTSASHAAGPSACPTNKVPVQIVSERSTDLDPQLAAAKISAPHLPLHTFIKGVTQHISTRLAASKLCIDSAESKKRSLLQFVNMPLVYLYKPVASPSLTLPAKSSADCRITSPWIDFAMGRSPTPWVRAVVRWNERQLLVDQAILAGMPNVPPGVPKQLRHDEFASFATMYHEDIKSQVGVAKKRFDERIPPELLWLFLRSLQLTPVEPFFMNADSAMSVAMKKGRDGYTNLVAGLIDQCTDSDKSDIRYNNIGDITNPIVLKKYKIDQVVYQGG